MELNNVINELRHLAKKLQELNLRPAYGLDTDILGIQSVEFAMKKIIRDYEEEQHPNPEYYNQWKTRNIASKWW